MLAPYLLNRWTHRGQIAGPAKEGRWKSCILGCSAVALHVCLSHVHEEILKRTVILPISLASLRSVFGAFRASKF